MGDLGSILWRREWLPTPAFWPGEFHELYIHGAAKSRTRLSDFHFHFFFSPNFIENIPKVLAIVILKIINLEIAC